MTQPLIELSAVTVGYDENNPVLKDFSFSLPQGSFTALVGGNGSGKSTLVKTILGLLKVRSGTVKLFGTEEGHFRERFKIGYLPQTPNHLNTFPANVREIVMSGLLNTKRFPRTFTRDDVRKVKRALDRLHIGDLEKRFINELSGGQRRKVLLARALVAEPELLILDEPTTEFDPNSRSHFYELIRELHEKQHVTVLLVSHDSATVGAYASHLAVVENGTLFFFGTFEAFCRSGEMSERFGKYAQHLICHQHCDCCHHSHTAGKEALVQSK